jgi:hypothetical protein
MAAAIHPGPAEAVERCEALVAAGPEAEREGAKNPCTSRNGPRFSFLDADGTMALRTSDEMRVRFGERWSTHPVMQYNRMMNGYVEIPDELFADVDTLGRWFAESWDWIGTVKPEPTKK